MYNDAAFNAYALCFVGRELVSGKPCLWLDTKQLADLCLLVFTLNLQIKKDPLGNRKYVRTYIDHQFELIRARGMCMYVCRTRNENSRKESDLFWP